MRFASLGSGSAGNALIVEADGTRLLLDCGLPVRETERRLARLGLAAADLTGIVVTHEHSDHVDGVFPFARKHGLTVWLTWGTLRAAGVEPDKRTVLIDGHAAFAVGDLEVHPYPVPHDAREPVQYAFSNGDAWLGVLTDAGGPTRHIEAMLSGCDALVLECNHDPEMLARGVYPGWLKARIAGPLGHLANDTSAAILASLDTSRLRHLIAAHLSQQNNTAALARTALASVLGCAPDWIGIADQADGCAWRSLR